MLPAGEGRKPRLLFCSPHCYVDSASGAAQCTRDLLTLLAQRGWTCGVLSGAHQDRRQGSRLEQLLREDGVLYSVQHLRGDGESFSVFQFIEQGVVVTLLDGHEQNLSYPPKPAEGKTFLALLESILDQFQPDLVLTYGGDWLAYESIIRIKRRGMPVTFALHNFAYQDAAFFQPIDAIVVPSEFARTHYRRALGLECTAIPGPWRWDRLRCEVVERKYATFVNPEPNKGLFWFARLAEELGRRRPDIPLLVVEGRGQADWLGQVGIDFSTYRNLFRLANTADSRQFYRLSRVVLMPSLWRESFSRVAVESCLNGIPILGSRRGGMPETLAKAGLLLEIPERYQPETRLLPSAAEVAPWVETLVRLWDDAAFYETERRRCLSAAEAWRPERLLPRFEAFFARVLREAARSAKAAPARGEADVVAVQPGDA
jgi:glycosyltransferase involved in cell wall biosynthesis